MPLTFNTWRNPKTGTLRVYLNGLEPSRAHVYWDVGADTPSVSSHDASVQTATHTALREMELHTMSYTEALARARGNLPTPANPITPNDAKTMLRNAIEAANIVHLVPAARMAGLKFKNGTLNKPQLIERIFDQPLSTIQQVATNLAQIRAGLKAPKSAAQNLDDWLDNEEAPAPVQPEAPSAQQLVMQPSVDLTPYALKTEVERVQAIFALAGNKAQTRMGNIEGEIQALRNLRPIEVHFPEKPTAVRIEGIAHPQFLDLLISLRAGLHCMLVGPAGSGKTYSAEQAAKALDRRFHMQGAISYAHELLGYIDAHSRYVRTQFRDAFEHGGLILLDEFDASAAEAALVLNAALANGACSFPDGLVSKHADFLCVLGANTDGSGATMQYAGRARLDGAFLDRFVVFDWQIDPRIEESLSQGNTQWLAAILAIRAFAHQRQIVDVVATPRATQRGALLASQGMDKTRILERTCKRGALVESWPEVLRLPAVASFLKS